MFILQHLQKHILNPPLTQEFFPLLSFTSSAYALICTLFISHVRSHNGLPEPLTLDNSQADSSYAISIRASSSFSWFLSPKRALLTNTFNLQNNKLNLLYSNALTARPLEPLHAHKAPTLKVWQLMFAGKQILHVSLPLGNFAMYMSQLINILAIFLLQPMWVNPKTKHQTSAYGIFSYGNPPCHQNR